MNKKVRCIHKYYKMKSGEYKMKPGDVCYLRLKSIFSIDGEWFGKFYRNDDQGGEVELGMLPLSIFETLT